MIMISGPSIGTLQPMVFCGSVEVADSLFADISGPV